jgi:hypothetical protein
VIGLGDGWIRRPKPGSQDLNLPLKKVLLQAVFTQAGRLARSAVAGGLSRI